MFKLFNDSQKSLTKTKVLEVGCGVGRWANIMIKLGADYHGVDISSDMIEIAKKKVLDGSFEVIDGQNLACFPSNSFDFSFTVTVLHHIPYKEKEKLISEIVRVTKVEGNIIIIEDISRTEVQRGFFNMFSYTMEGWLDVFKNLGCESVKIRKHKFLYGKLFQLTQRSVFLRNKIFAKLWTDTIEEVAVRTMPWRFFTGVAVLFKKKS